MKKIIEGWVRGDIPNWLEWQTHGHQPEMFMELPPIWNTNNEMISPKKVRITIEVDYED